MGDARWRESAKNEKGAGVQPPQSTCCFCAEVIEVRRGREPDQPGGGPDRATMAVNSAWDAVDSKATGSWADLRRVASTVAPIHPRRRDEGAHQPSQSCAAHDAHVLKFKRTGRWWQIGKRPRSGQAIAEDGQPAWIRRREAANELYIADGLGNRRVLVVDAATGAYKRHWGAYGGKPDDAPLPAYNPNPSSNAPLPRQFQNVGCVRLSRDGMVYVCDRQGDRIQVFQRTQVRKEAYV